MLSSHDKAECGLHSKCGDAQVAAGSPPQHCRPGGINTHPVAAFKPPKGVAEEGAQQPAFH